MMELWKKVLSVSAGLAIAATAAGAQTSGTITGRVLTEASAPLPSASVSITSLGLGAYTNERGEYTITIPASNLNGQTVTITARRVGYAPRSYTETLVAGAKIAQDFALTANPNQLTGVVVTALGVERSKSQLGTAQQQLSSEQINRTQNPNVVNAMQGKVSGVQITTPNTVGGSTRIVIRGANSISGSNTPLFVVDGIPIANDQIGGSGASADASRGYDFGSTINDINPDDIATLSVLKGPNAAALYGSRAANGVVLITTKRGHASGGKVTTAINSSVTFDRVGKLPDYQNLYGQGAGGEFGYLDGAGGGYKGTDGLDQSWGPRLDGRLLPQFDSPLDAAGNPIPTPWVAHPNNVASFFTTGTTYSNNVAFSGGSETADGRLSFGADQTKGIIPDNNLSKFTGSLSGNLKVSSRLSTNASVQYARNTGANRPGSGYTTSTLEQFVWFARQVDLNELKAKQYNADGSLYNWNSNYHNNPYWIANANPEKDQRDHVIATGAASYKMTDWLNATLRSGTDFYRQNINQNWGQGNVDQSVGPFAVNTAYGGAFAFTHSLNNENNTELFFNANKQANSHLQLNATLGANRRYATFHRDVQQTPGILVPGVYNVTNAAITPTLGQYDQALQVNSGYGSGSFTWNNYWTVEVTGRNDWSSTLPKANHSYFYPSINTSLVLTDMVPGLKNRVLDYAKIRGSVARVGAGASPYQLRTTYSGYSTQFGSLPLFTLGDQLANANLLPEQTQSGEAGLELGLFNNRITFDGTIYDKATSNQIINLAVSNSTGFSSRVTNAGRISNHGVEMLLTAIPIQMANGFQWTSTFNYARNRNKVDALAPGLNTIVIQGFQGTVNVEARAGQPYGSLFGGALLRDTVTHQLLLQDGLPQLDPVRRVLGNINPDWIGGWNNEFRFKNVTLSALLDIHRGGSIYSITNYYGTGAGVLASSLLGREVSVTEPGVLVKGIDEATGKPNTTVVHAEDYWQNFSFVSQIDEPFIYDDSWLRLKELRIGFDLPRSLAQAFRSQSVNVAFIGRNLWLSSKVPNVDPEVTYNIGNAQGAEFASIPQARSFGLNLRITP